jgi:hypothetical protein
MEPAAGAPALKGAGSATARPEQGRHLAPPAAAARFSVLIPLEFTRGIAERCVRAWTVGMEYPRERYELLIAAPEDYDPIEIAVLEAMLAPQDRIVSVAAEHDIALVAEAACRVEGEMLVFTEAHCIPEPGFLAACDRALAENPSWAGFSGGSRPLVHNLLSEVEAEMYVTDIERNLREHPWLKVLDQCFVIERRAYEACGGLDERFGHFAEHLLAARLHRAGTRIGYDPRAGIAHHYVGETGELIEFARDYGFGELLFAAGAAGDPCGDLFMPPATWRDRHAAEPAVALRMLRMLLTDLPAALHSEPGVSGRAVSRQRLWARGMIRWAGAAVASPSLRRRVRRLILDGRTARLRLWLGLRRRGRAAAAFIALNDAAAALGAAEAFERLHGEASRFPARAGLVGNPHLSEWTAATAELVPAAGFHDLELFDREPFRWSQPAAMVSIDSLAPGDRVRIAWGPLDGQGHAQARLYLNERRVPDRLIAHGDRSTTITVDRALAPARLGWVTGPLAETGDARPLGLPVSKISWTRSSGAGPAAAPPRERDDLAGMRRAGSAAVPGADPFYLLHVQKCGGTSLRTVIGNAFPARERLARTHSLYYANELAANRELLERPFALAIGHFGWDLPAAVPNRNLQVMTVLREPVSHLRSLHAYLVLQAFLPASLPFGDWLRDELRMRDTLIGHLCAGALGTPERGIAATAATVAEREQEATAALRSCTAVGVFERLDDSLNLICAETGALPPVRVPHLNPSLAPREVSPDEELTTLEARRLLAAETRVHRLATELCDRRIATLYEDLAEGQQQDIDAGEARSRLRDRWFRRHGERIGPGELASPFAWLPDDAFAGENLHPLEEHGGLALRWTGADELTRIHLPIDTDLRWRLRIALHPASPGDHIDAAGVRVNGRELELGRTSARALAPINGGGHVLEAIVEAPACNAETSPFSTLELVSPVRQGEGEFRLLGLALCGLVLEPVP